MPPQDIVFTELPTGDNHIGRVTIAAHAPLAEGTSHIGSVSVDGAVTIANPGALAAAANLAEHKAFEEIVGANTFTFDMRAMGVGYINKIIYLTNEGTDSLFVAFDDTGFGVATQDGFNAYIRLNAGDSLEDVPRRCSQIHVKRSSGSTLTGTVRFMGV
jgi:hypothetical protein